MSLDRGKYDSDEEVYFSWWINEMVEAGMITKVIYQPKPFLLSETASFDFIEVMKTKTKQRTINVLQDHYYTADWLIVWASKTHLKIHASFDDKINESIKRFDFISQYNNKKDYYFSVIDIKGTFAGQHNSTAITFPINQKWVYNKYNIYIQKVITKPQISIKKGTITPKNALFLKTFVPGRFLVTDGMTKARKIRYNFMNIDEYLQSRGVI